MSAQPKALRIGGIVIAILAVIAVVALCLRPLVRRHRLSPVVTSAIEKGVGYLERSQLPSGEFRTCASADPLMRDECAFDGSPFATSLIVYSLSRASHPAIGGITERALRFLRDDMSGPGIWRYWSRSNPKHRDIDPDLDDIACVSFVLRKFGAPFPPNERLLIDNRAGEGRFRVWLRSGRFQVNEFDCVVDTNVLLYLGERPETQAACASVNAIINAGTRCGRYYPSPLSLYYMHSRALREGIACLGKSREAAVDGVIRTVRGRESSGNALHAALAACALLNYQRENRTLDRLIDALIELQRPDGSWRRSTFYLGPAPYYGSDELTTALALEALAGYLKTIQR